MFPNYCDNPKHLVTFPNAPWGIVSLPNFENHWVPNTHSHLINIAHTHTVHQMLAWLVPSSQSWEWVSLYQTIFLSYSGGRFKDASTLAAPTVARFFRGFSTDLLSRPLCFPLARLCTSWISFFPKGYHSECTHNPEIQIPFLLEVSPD